VDDAVYVWDNGQYAGYVGGVAVMSGNLNRYIPPMQGFFVHVNADGGTVPLRNAYRTHANQRYLKSKINNLVKIKLSANGYDDYMAIRFEQDATEEFDGHYDVLRMFTNKTDIPQLFAITTKEKDPLALSALPVSTLPERTVQLGINIGQASECSISAAELNGFDSINIWLEDKLLGTLYNLRSKEPYVFEYNGGDDRSRFVLHFGLNHAPVFTGTNTLEVRTYIPYFFDLTKFFKDQDTADQLTITSEKLPNFAQTQNNQLFILAKDQNLGYHDFTLKAKDLLNTTTSTEIKINVLPNRPPTALAPSEIRVFENFEYILKIDTLFSDPDKGDKLSFTVLADTNLWIKIDTTNHLIIAKPSEQDTAITVTIKATDLAGNTTNHIISFVPLHYDGKFLIYPNPTNSYFKVLFKQNNATLRLWSSSGKLVFEKQIYPQQTINIKDLPAGVYIVELKELGAKKKLIVK
jgi:hypothetical protein